MPYRKCYDVRGRKYRKYHVNCMRSRRDKYSTPFRYKRYIESWRFGYINLLDYAHQATVICPSGYTWGQGWGILNRCWLGFKMAKAKEKSLDMMVTFAKKIQSIQYDLGIKTSDFSHIGLPGDVLVLYDKPPNKQTREFGQIGVEEERKEKEEEEEEVPEEELNTYEYLQDIWLHTD